MPYFNLGKPSDPMGPSPLQNKFSLRVSLPNYIGLEIKTFKNRTFIKVKILYSLKNSDFICQRVFDPEITHHTKIATLTSKAIES